MQNKWLIPWILGLGLLMETLDTTVLNTALPQMALSFSVNALTLKLAIISYVITLAVCLPMSGYLTDRFGTQKVFFIAVAVFVGSSFLCGISQNLPELIIGRLLQGVGGAMVTPVARLILLKIFERSEFIKAFTSLVLVGQMGVAFGPTLGGLLTTWMGWRWVFFLNLPIGVFLLFLIARFIPNYSEEALYDFDKRGFLLFSTAIGLITFGFALMTEQGFQNDTWAIIFTCCGLLFFISYFWHAKYFHRPLLNFLLMKIHTFRVSFFGAFLSRIPLNAPFFLLTLLLQISFGFSAFKAGVCLIPYGLFMMLTRTSFAKILQRFGYRRCLIINPILIAIVLFLFSYVTSHTSLWIILFLIGILGMLSSFQFSGMNSLAFADVDARDTSQASLITGVFQQLAMSLSVCVAAGLLVALSHMLHVTILTLATFHITFIILSVLMLCSILVFRHVRPGDGGSLLKK